MGQDGKLDHPHRTTEEGPRMKVKKNAARGNKGRRFGFY